MKIKLIIMKYKYIKRVPIADTPYKGESRMSRKFVDFAGWISRAHCRLLRIGSVVGYGPFSLCVVLEVLQNLVADHKGRLCQVMLWNWNDELCYYY
jgi:hypothetical protein